MYRTNNKTSRIELQQKLIEIEKARPNAEYLNFPEEGIQAVKSITVSNVTGKTIYSLKVWRDSAAKAIVNIYCYKMEIVDAEIERCRKSQRAHKNFKAEQKAKEAAVVNNYKVGDILHRSWGYSMCLNDFYQVVEVKPKSILVREIAAKTVGGEDMGGGTHVVPLPNQFCTNSEVKMMRAKSAYSKWDGKPCYENHND